MAEGSLLNCSVPVILLLHEENQLMSTLGSQVNDKPVSWDIPLLERSGTGQLAQGFAKVPAMFNVVTPSFSTLFDTGI